MTKKIEEKLQKIPIINITTSLLMKIKLPGLVGLSLYDLLELYIIGIAKGALSTRASAIAYNFFVALFPFLLFVIIIIPLIPIDNFQADFLSFLESFLPPTTSDFFHNNIFRTLESSNQKVGLISSVLVLSLFLMANGVNALFSAFEHSYHEQLLRSFFKQYFYALGVALILVLLLLVIVAGYGYFQIYVIDSTLEVLNKYGYYQKKSYLIANIAKYMFFIMMVYLTTATLYYFGTKEGRTSKFFSAGALLSTLLIILISYLFGIYIENFSKYNELYGSIGALMILLIYLWLNSNILLLGFELNMSLRQLKKRKKRCE